MNEVVSPIVEMSEFSSHTNGIMSSIASSDYADGDDQPYSAVPISPSSKFMEYLQCKLILSLL